MSVEINEQTKEVHVHLPCDGTNIAPLMNEALAAVRERGPEWKLRMWPQTPLSGDKP